jgi:thiamine-monophosphate kinase
MSLGEFELITRYFAQQASRPDVLLGIGDDAAVLDVRTDRKLVVAMDTIVEGVHFPEAISAADIGYRALAVNLSDLAAMGAEPAWFMLSLSMPTSSEQWVEQFAAGMFALAREHNLALIGGDTVKGPLVVTVQIAGWVEEDCWLTRSGARPGDAIMVSGALGDAAGALTSLQHDFPETVAVRALRQRFLRPTPRIELGRALRGLASAAMDVSDGLLTDLDKLCAASQCGADIDIDTLPISAHLRSTFDDQACVDYALAGGDDYEIIFTIPADAVAKLDSSDPGCTRIGSITVGAGVVCHRAGQIFNAERRGYDHFNKERSQ